MLLWARSTVRQYDNCASQLDQVINAWPKGSNP